jgi:hypothetical protein
VVRAEQSRGHSRGGLFSTRPHDSSSDNVNYRHVLESAVLASELEQLPDLQGFLKIASTPAWTRVTLPLPR